MAASYSTIVLLVVCICTISLLTGAFGQISDTFDCPTPFGYFNDPETKCSNKFIQCSHYDPFVKTCYPGLIWNSNIVACDYRSNVPGCA